MAFGCKRTEQNCTEVLKYFSSCSGSNSLPWHKDYKKQNKLMSSGLDWSWTTRCVGQKKWTLQWKSDGKGSGSWKRIKQASWKKLKIARRCKVLYAWVTCRLCQIPLSFMSATCSFSFKTPLAWKEQKGLIKTFKTILSYFGMLIFKVFILRSTKLFYDIDGGFIYAMNFRTGIPLNSSSTTPPLVLIKYNCLKLDGVSFTEIKFKNLKLLALSSIFLADSILCNAVGLLWARCIWREVQNPSFNRLHLFTDVKCTRGFSVWGLPEHQNVLSTLWYKNQQAQGCGIFKSTYIIWKPQPYWKTMGFTHTWKFFKGSYSANLIWGFDPLYLMQYPN